MSRLSATDAFFAYADTPEAPMNMGSVQLLKLPANYRGDFFSDYRDFVAERIEYLPKLKKRLVDNALGLPHWEDYPDFRLEDHLRRTSVRLEDDDKALSRKLGRLQLIPFDQSKPLFMFYMIEGLPGNRVALVQKYHHALADGKTAVRMMDLFSDEGFERARREDDLENENMPGYVQRSVAGVAEEARRTLASVPGIVGAVGKMFSEGGGEMLDRVKACPQTRFNQPLSERRLFAHRTWPLQDVNAVRRAAGLTFNEMGLALLGGALRRYLDELDELPAESLLCNVPVALEARGKSSGNAVVATSIPLGSHYEDRKERLTYLKAESEACKGFIADVVDGASSGSGVQLPSYLIRVAAMYTGSPWLAKHMPPPSNITMSNVPAPEETIHVAGAEVESLFGLPMILQGLAVSTTFSSYAGHAVSSILCCAEALPDPERIHDYMEQELESLRKTYAKTPKKKGARRKSGS